MERRQFKIFWLAVILGLFLGIHVIPGAVFAQGKYPTRPINFLIGYPAGGTTDVCARPLVAAAGKILGQPVGVVNKPGAASAVAMALLKNEKPEGNNVGILPSRAVLTTHRHNV